MLVSLYVLSMVYSNGLKMVTRSKNTYKSLEEQMNYYEVGEPTLQQTAKPILEIIENGKTVDLGSDLSEFDKYINIRLRNIIKNFDNNT